MTNPSGQAVIRAARPADVPAILRMQRDLSGLHLALDPARFVVPENIEAVYTAWLDRAATGTDLLAMVAQGQSDGAEKDDGILAYMIAEAMPAYAEYWSPACVYIHDIFVRPGLRSGGVGARLADEATAWARSKSITQVRGLVAMGNRDGQAFFQRLGFRLATVEACKDV